MILYLLFSSFDKFPNIHIIQSAFWGHSGRIDRRLHLHRGNFIGMELGSRNLIRRSKGPKPSSYLHKCKLLILPRGLSLRFPPYSSLHLYIIYGILENAPIYPYLYFLPIYNSISITGTAKNIYTKKRGSKKTNPP